MLDLDGRWGEEAYDLGDITLAVWTDQTVVTLVPFVCTLVAIHHLAGAGGIEMSLAAARGFLLICHGVSYALVGSESSQPEAHCQACCSQCSERQSGVVCRRDSLAQVRL